MSIFLPLKESARDLVVEIVRPLAPYFPDITPRWRQQLSREFHFDNRVLAALERLTVATGCGYFLHKDFAGYLENLEYFGARLAKLEVDTRSVARALEIYQEYCEPYLHGLFGERHLEALAALEMVSSAAFVAVSGAYYDIKTRQQSSLISVLDAELNAVDLNALLQRVLEIGIHAYDASCGLILLRELDGDGLRVSASVGLKDFDKTGYAVAVGEGFAGSIALSGEPELVLDVSADPRVISDQLRRDAKTLWGMPINHEGETIGVMVLGFDRPYEWLPSELELLRAIADRSGLAIDRFRINQALREREARIAELTGHLLQAQEEERKRISRELHDETGQALMVIRLYLGMLDASLTARTAKARVRETLEVVDRTIEGIRRIIGRLSPLVLQELGLVAAIRKEAKDLAKNTGVKARVAISDEVGRLAPETETAIYRVVQEALHNVAKHAQAKSVNITLGRIGTNVQIAVEDDGIGMPAKLNFRGHSFGLAGIKERVGMLGGSVRVESSKGKGTRLDVTVPADRAEGMHRAQSAMAGMASITDQGNGLTGPGSKVN